MPTPKNWTAHDLALGKLTITRDGDWLMIDRRYTFLDSEGNELTGIEGGRIVRHVLLSQISTEVQAALAKIDQWTYAQALLQEGMAVTNGEGRSV